MISTKSITRRREFTFKANLKHTRYGWLRLTPAYSVHLVADLLDELPQRARMSEGVEPDIVLDPFCGTGTTALVCAERGIACDTSDINPFLLWLTQAKTRQYTTEDILAFHDLMARTTAAIMTDDEADWVPPLHQIEKWWNPSVLGALARAHRTISEAGASLSPAALDLGRIAFCRTIIEWSNAVFNHQSMSFAAQSTMNLWPEESLRAQVADSFRRAVKDIAGAAISTVLCQPNVLLCDARNLSTKLRHNHYSHVITSPPYPNRMSYIRELRPYMYWLGYLQDGRQAGEMD